MPRGDGTGAGGQAHSGAGRPAPGGGRLYPARGLWPRLGNRVLVCPGAVLAGDVTVGEGVSIWYNAVLRGDLAAVVVGPGTNVQDGAVVHVDEGYPAAIGAGVTIGHRAVIHGCTVGDGSLVGMGAVILTGARVGEEALVAAGSLVPEGRVIPPRTLALGVPARIVRELTPGELERLRRSATEYRSLAQDLLGQPPPGG